jgi:tripartite-type tricarboxylate transporter receptor subunit TctC
MNLVSRLAASLAATALAAGAALAQGYPERGITMVVPFAAGGPPTPSAA